MASRVQLCMYSTLKAFRSSGLNSQLSQCTPEQTRKPRTILISHRLSAVCSSFSDPPSQFPNRYR
ncbi:hypothetical protein K443DRAFT_680873 [Laccaria amethystina LaAM-08-1]|uniref:Uncharacterized protein n=1 Tax=Laccaria amethystina LaAM-08-1 TaxID=1095629 RepID=A0A0C9WZQ3_9AGAR|nr:hypothetical protein K443DRAFT_680873 [Laccaria amethystina LaAM-08-1]